MNFLKGLFLNKKSQMLFQSLITFGLRGAGVAFLFGLTLLMTRNFEPVVVGEYEFIRVYLLVIGSIVLLGTDVSIVYFAGKLKALQAFSSLKNVYVQILKIIGLLSLILNVLFFVFASEQWINSFFDQNIYSLIKLAVLFVPFYAITLFNTETLRALEKPILSELFRNIFKFTPLLIGIIISLFYNSSLLTIAEFYVYGFGLLSIFSEVIVLCFFSQEKVSSQTYIYGNKEVIKRSFPMGISSIIMFMLLGVDIFLLKKYYGSDIVAYYSVAVKLITILSMVILSLNINYSPKISELYILKKKEELQELCKKVAKITFLVNVFVGILLILFSGVILSFFGEQYLQIRQDFYILIVSQIFTSAFGVVPVYLNMTGRSHIFQYILLLTLAVNILLNWILIPIYSSTGAALTFSLSVILWNILAVIYIYKQDKINLFFK